MPTSRVDPQLHRLFHPRQQLPLVLPLVLDDGGRGGRGHRGERDVRGQGVGGRAGAVRVAPTALASGTAWKQDKKIKPDKFNSYFKF